jgi:DNA-binding GntR family transcriptional regulator
MQLARRYQLGKAPVRAALVRLRQEGLVSPVPRRGYMIAPITIKDVQDLFEFRLLLEPGMARLAAGRVGPEDIRRLKAMCRADKLSGTAFNRANTDFHVAIARAAGNERVAVSLCHLHEWMERLFHLKLSSEDQSKGIEEHNLLLEALVRGDAGAAEEAAMLHIEKARKKVMDAIFSSPDLMSVQITGPRTLTAATPPRAVEAVPRLRRRALRGASGRLSRLHVTRG